MGFALGRPDAVERARRYLQIFRRLEESYDQTVHPQKRRDVRKVRARETCPVGSVQRVWPRAALGRGLGGATGEPARAPSRPLATVSHPDPARRLSRSTA